MAGGTVVSIHIAPDAGLPMEMKSEVRAVAGMGLEGDRYYLRRGTYAEKGKPWRPDREVSLIEEEAVEAANRDYELNATPGEIRRNIVTRGVALNHLVGKEFTIGKAKFLGIQLCEPCGHMEQLVAKPGIKKALIHRGGLNAQVLEDGVVRVGDPLHVL